MTQSVTPEIARWQSEGHEIGMLEFAPTDEAAERFPFYPLPESAIFLGLIDVDALCLASDGSLCVYDCEVEDRIVCSAAMDQVSFVAAMNELERYFIMCLADDSHWNDLDEAARVRDHCAEVAGGDDYASYFSSLLGV